MDAQAQDYMQTLIDFANHNGVKIESVKDVDALMKAHLVANAQIRPVIKQRVLEARQASK